MEQIILTRPIQSVCVYCGSGQGLDKRFAQAARALGQSLAQSGLRLVYGGGGNGLMGETARAALASGGHVTGIIPQSLVALEHPIETLSELIVVGSLHERKMLMFERSDAFVALPGGLGTLEELIEQLTWSQLKHHEKPIVLVNVARYWDLLLQLFDRMMAETFIRPDLMPSLFVVETARQAANILLRAQIREPATKADDRGAGRPASTD